MRPAPTAAMCAATLAVVVLSLRSAAGQHVAAPVAAPAGVVVTTAQPAPASSHPDPTAPVKPRPSRRTPAAVTPTTAAAPPRPRRTTATPSAPRTTAVPTRSAAPTSTTVNGRSVDTRYGPVQVQITVQDRRIVRAVAIDYPQSSGRDQEINSSAVPQLQQETLQAQSARIDTVSGATYTSNGYVSSLQSALDAAHQAGAL